MADAHSSGALNVLVVDDDGGMRTLISRMLKRMKIDHVIEVESGQQALERLSAAPGAVSIVICDWNMPGMSGMDLFRQVHASTPKLPFLMLTGRGDLDSVVAARKAGVHGYLLKPVSPLQLQAKIASLLGAAQG